TSGKRKRRTRADWPESTSTASDIWTAWIRSSEGVIMRTLPTAPNNKYTHLKRLEECEVVASNALTAAKEALAQLKLQPPRGETGERGLMGANGKDAVCCCRNG